MNQYSIITSRLPVIPLIPPTIPPPPPPPTSVNVVPNLSVPTNESVFHHICETEHTASTSAKADSALPSTSFIAENVPSTSTSQDIPNTSKDFLDKVRTDAELVKIEDLGSEEHIDLVKVNTSVASNNESSEASELRRRRLQKFLKSEQTKD